MEFGDQLKGMRKNKGVSQKELGEALNLGQTTIANYEKNIRFPNGEILIRIRDFFNCSFDDLLVSNEKELVEPLSLQELEKLRKQVYDYAIKEDEIQIKTLLKDLKTSNERRVQLYEEVFNPVLRKVGNQWQDGKLSVAKEHYISNLLREIIDGLKFESQIEKTNYKGAAICLSLASEPHTIGIKMIADYFTMLGYKTYYLGTNVPTDALIDMIMETKPSIIAFSATMEYHLDSLTNVISVIRSNEEIKVSLGEALQIVVGGQGIASSKVALDIGANIYATDFNSLKSQLD